MPYRVGLLIVVIGLLVGGTIPAAGQDDSPLTCTVVELAHHDRQGFENMVAVNGDLLLYREVVPDGFQRIDLIALPLDNPAGRTRLNVEGDVEAHWFAVSPRGDGVVFVQLEPDNETYHLYYTPLPDIAPPVMLSLPSGPNGETPVPRGIQLTPDGTHLVVNMNYAPTYDVSTLVVIDLATQQVMTLVAGWETANYLYLTVTDTHALYTGKNMGMQLESQPLFSVPLDGSSPPVRLDERSAINGIDPHRVAVVGDRVVFMAYVRQSSLGGRVFSAPLDGSASAVLYTTAPPPVIDPAFLEHHPFFAAPDGAHLIYIAYSDDARVFRVVQLDVLTGAVETLSYPMSPLTDADAPAFVYRGAIRLVVPLEAQHILYESTGIDGETRTYRYALDSGEAVTLPGRIPLIFGARVDARGDHALVYDYHVGTLHYVDLRNGQRVLLADEAPDTTMRYGFASDGRVFFTTRPADYTETVLYLATCE